MATVKLIEYEEASPEVREVYDELRTLRKTEHINNFWKALANHPTTLQRIWNQLKMVMGPGEIDPLTKEFIYIAVSIANNCDYCIHSHTASAFGKGMTMAQYEELMAIVGMAHQTNGLASGLKVPVDEQYLK
ncbi:MAG: carboxymuconolactone decarboxylase family protein [Ardenticatenaceae bacterium]